MSFGVAKIPNTSFEVVPGMQGVRIRNQLKTLRLEKQDRECQFRHKENGNL